MVKNWYALDLSLLDKLKYISVQVWVRDVGKFALHGFLAFAGMAKLDIGYFSITNLATTQISPIGSHGGGAGGGGPNTRDKNTKPFQRNRTIIPSGPINTGLSISADPRFLLNSAVSGVRKRLLYLHPLRI